MTATIEAIIHAGGKPRLVDIDPVTLNIDPVGVEGAIGRRTRVIVAVDIAGFPCDYGRLNPLAKKHKLFLLDDAAHAFGAVYKKRPVGSIADATVFSFYPTKNITTGEGGMVLSDHKRLVDKVRHLSLHAMTSSGWQRYRGGNWRYDVTALGYKFNMPDLNAALGIGQLRNFSCLQARRRQLARRYYRCLNDLKEYIELPPKAADIDPAWQLFIIKINRRRWSIGRDRLIVELEKRGVGCGVHYIPVYRFSYYRDFLKLNAKQFAHAENAHCRVISLPFYPDLHENEVDYIGEVLTGLVQKFGR
jgi:dTDP-4-amino-4,6-dideoxygalactose transaminase